jgi:hypothetical protein
MCFQECTAFTILVSGILSIESDLYMKCFCSTLFAS